MSFPIPDRVSPSGPLAQASTSPFANLSAMYHSTSFNVEGNYMEWDEVLNRSGFALNEDTTGIIVPTVGLYLASLSIYAVEAGEGGSFIAPIVVLGSPDIQIGVPAAGSVTVVEESRSTTGMREISDTLTQLIGATFDDTLGGEFTWEAVLTITRLGLLNM